MGRYVGPVCRLCRREGEKLFLKGAKCYTLKCPVERRKFPPGEHGPGRVRFSKMSDYGLQLREKQKIRRIYGVGENQFRLYFHRASRMKGVTGENLLRLLECRLDNVIYRMGFASSRSQARQIVSHRHILVNSRVVSVPSCLVRPGDTVAVRGKSMGLQPVQIAVASAAGRAIPAWLSVNMDQLVGQVLHGPTRDQIDTRVREQMVVEFYSR